MPSTLSQYGRTLLSLATPFTLMFSGPLLAQGPTRITSDVVCPDCSLALEHVVTLGTRDGPGYLVGDPVTVTRDSRGFYYVLQFMERSAILVYDDAGAFVQRIGRRGQGPGEYQRIEFIRLARGDTLHVYDAGTSRHSVLDPSWEYVTGKLLQLPKLHSVVELENGEEVFNGVTYAPDRIGFVLHTLDEEGRPRSSFGNPDSLAFQRGDLPYLSWRRMTPGGGNRVWAAPPSRYVLELWDSNGEKYAELVRDADWFEPWVDRAPPTPDEPFPPFLGAIHLGPAGNLWVATHVPAEDWAAKLGPPVETAMGQRYRPTPGAFDTVIEVVDTEEGRVFLSQRISPNVSGFIDEYYVYAYRWDEEGVPYIDVWSVRVGTP